MARVGGGELGLEPGEEVDRVVDHQAQGDDGDHDGGDVEGDAEPRHEGEGEEDRQEVGDQGHEGQAQRAQHGEHQEADDDERQRQALDLAGEEVALHPLDEVDHACGRDGGQVGEQLGRSLFDLRHAA